MASKASRLALTILTCAGLSLPPTAAEAGMRTGTWANGMVAGPYGIGWYGSRFGGWGYGGGYYPGYYGYGYAPGYYGGYGYYPDYYYYRRRSNSGAALAAGLIGGIALGAILANSTARAYPRCYVAPRRIVSPSGHIYTRRVRVC